MRLPVAAALLVVPLLMVGCGQFQAAPLVSTSEFPNALRGIERRTEEILAAFDAGTPKAADASMHALPQLIGVAHQLAEPAGLDNDQIVVFNRAIDSLTGAVRTLHAPMHQAEFPEDFDFEPIRTQLETALTDLRSSLPQDLANDLERAKQQRAAANAETLGPTPNTGTALPAAGAPIAAVAARTPTRSPAPLCPSVMLWDNASRELAPERVNRVAEIMEGVPPDRRWVQLVPTLHARLNDDLSIAEYGVMLNRQASWQSADNFEVANDGLADRLRDAFAGAIGQAVRRGLHVAILPHLDPAAGIAEWRNLYRFAPGERIGAGSYESLLLEPLADAIKAEATADTRIDFALSGEMGRSFFEHPEEYLAILRRLRARFAGNPRTAGVRIGVSLNWSGDMSGDLTVSEYTRGDARELLAACDFIGISLYPSVSLPPVALDFEKGVSVARLLITDELGHVSISPMPPMIISEVGLGARSGAGVEKTAKAPWNGLGNPNANPWSDVAMRGLRRDYHTALCDYLANSKVERAFLWSEGPWDPQGIADRRFRDEEIAAMIRRHNQADAP